MDPTAHPDDPIDQLLAECLDLPEADRPGCLDAQCLAHPDRAHELRRRYARLVTLGLVDASIPGDPAPERLGPYRLLRRLGAGTMGVVWLAEDQRLGRQVALKLLRREQVFFEGARRRFRREMEAAARLDHPALCSIYDAGEADGMPYLAMRYVAGISLDQWLADERGAGITGGVRDAATRCDQVCTWVAALAEGLHVAHEAGFVHRDVKPANVVLDRDQQPVLLDFGLAHALETGPGARLTATGAQLGTPAYMAPEQVLGEPVDRRTDVWALGVMLYECLTLRLPFAATTRESLYREILASDVVLAHRIDRTVPEDLALVVATAMARRPGDRYPTARGLAEDLRRILRREPIVARRPPPWLRARRWTQRHPAATAVLALLSFSLAITVGFLVRLDRNLRRTSALVLAAEVRKALEEDPTLAVLLAREALDLLPSVETRSAAMAALARSRCVEFHEFESPPRQAAWLAGDPPALVVRTDAGVFWQRGGSAWRMLLPCDGSEAQLAVAAAGQVVLLREGAESAARESGGRLHAWRCGQGMDPVPLDLGVDRCRGIAADPSLPLVLVFLPRGKALVIDALEVGRRWELDASLQPPRRVAFSPDGQCVALVERPQGAGPGATEPPTLVRVHRLDGSHPPQTHQHAKGVEALAFAADGRLWTASPDGALRGIAADGEVFAFPRHDAGFRWIRTAGAAPRALTLDWRGDACLWDLEQRRLLWRNRAIPMASAAITSDGRHVAVQSGNVVRILDENDEVARVHHQSDIGSLSFSADGRRLLSSSSDRTVRVSDLSWQLMPILTGHGSAVREADWSPDGKTIVTASLDGVLRLWNPEHGRLERSIPIARMAGEPIGAGSSITSARFLDDGTILVATRDTLWFLERDGAVRRSMNLGQSLGMEHIPRVDVAPDQYHLVSCLTPTRALARATQSGVQLMNLQGDQVWHVPFDRKSDGIAYTAAFVDGGRAIAVGDDLGRVRVLDRATGRTLTGPWQAHRKDRQVGLVVAIPGGDRFVSTGFDGVARIWDVRGNQLGELYGHTNAIKGCDVHGHLLATASFDRTIRLWDLRTRTCLCVIEGHDDLVFDVRFSPDGRHLVSASWDRTARIWPTEMERLPALLQERAVRSFRAEERKRFAELLPTLHREK